MNACNGQAKSVKGTCRGRSGVFLPWEINHLVALTIMTDQSLIQGPCLGQSQHVTLL